MFLLFDRNRMIVGEVRGGTSKAVVFSGLVAWKARESSMMMGARAFGPTVHKYITPYGRHETRGCQALNNCCTDEMLESLPCSDRTKYPFTDYPP